MIKRILTLLLTLLVMTVGAFAEDDETAQTETDSVIALVNGEALMSSDYEPVRENYLFPDHPFPQYYSWHRQLHRLL